MGWGGVGEQGHYQAPERAQAADPLGEVDGESVPPPSGLLAPRAPRSLPPGDATPSALSGTWWGARRAHEWAVPSLLDATPHPQ